MLQLNSALFVSPLQYSRTVLVDQRLVVRLQLVDVWELGALCVQVKFAVERMEDAASGQCSEWDNVHMKRGRCSLELLDPGQHAQVFVIAQVHVVSVGVPGVERMKANHVQPLKTDRKRVDP